MGVLSVARDNTLGRVLPAGGAFVFFVGRSLPENAADAHRSLSIWHNVAPRRITTNLQDVGRRLDLSACFSRHLSCPQLQLGVAAHHTYAIPACFSRPSGGGRGTCRIPTEKSVC